MQVRLYSMVSPQQGVSVKVIDGAGCQGAGTEFITSINSQIAVVVREGGMILMRNGGGWIHDIEGVSVEVVDDDFSVAVGQQ